MLNLTKLSFAGMVLAITSCSSSNFSGSSGANGNSQNAKTGGNPQLGAPGSMSGPSSSPSPSIDPEILGGGSGGETTIVLPKPMTITGFQAQAMLSKFVSSGKGSYTTVPNNGNFVVDEPTIKQICVINFQSVGSSCDTAKVQIDYMNSSGIAGLYDGFYSCGDNTAAIWNAASKNFSVSNACAYNSAPHNDNLNWSGRINHGSIWMDRPVTCSCAP